MLAVLREVTGSRPPQVCYGLTPKGEALGPVLESVSGWAGRWCGVSCGSE